MSNSGSGRSFVDFSEDDRDPPAELEDPRLAADRAMQQRIGWLYASDRKAILDALDKHGLTICWKP